MRNPGSGGETRGGGPAAAAMSGAAEAGAGDEEDPEWASFLLSEIDGLIGEDELPLNAEMETYEKNFCDLDFDLDLMSWNSEPWDVSKQILADEDWKAEPLSPITSAESVPSPVSVDSPVQCVPEGTELGSNPQPSPIYLYSQSSQSPPLPVEEKEKKSLSKAKHCSANGSSVTLNRCNPLTTKPLIQPKPLLPAHAGLGVQAKAIVIPALHSLLTLPKQQPVVAIQPALPNGQPVTFSQSAVVHLQTPAIFPASKPAVAITGGITSLPGQTMNILSQTARKNSATANTLTKPVLNATSPNTGIEMNVLKRQQRMIKNRESACQSRRKRKEYMLNLEVRLKAALLENDHLKRENGLLKRQLDELAEENQDLKSSPPKRRAFYVMVLLAFIVLNYDRLSVLEWGSTSSEVHTRPAHQSRHLLEFSPGIPQETGDKNNNGYKHSVSDNKALMVVTEEPIIYISPPPCQPFINRTESLRLSHELRGWVHRHEAERTKSRRTSKNHLQKDQAAQNVTRKNANSELMALPYMDNSVGNSGSELQVYYASPRKYQDFFDAIHRKGDTFYVVSFRRDHLLLPATTHNKTRRPKMSIVLPAINISDKIINGQDYEVMMQIDCEVMDTRILHIKSSSIPPYLRDQQRNRTTSFYSSPLTVPEAAPVVRAYTESPK